MADVYTPSGIPWYVPYRRTQDKTVYSGEGGSWEQVGNWSSYVMYYIASNSQRQVGESSISTSGWKYTGSYGDADTYQRTQSYNRFYITYPIDMSGYSSVSDKIKSIIAYHTVTGYSDSAYDTYNYEISTKAADGTDLDYDELKPDTENSIDLSFTGGVPITVATDVTSLGFTPYGYVIAAPIPRGQNFKNITISNFRVEVHFANSIFTNVNGVWKEGTPYIKVGNTWYEGTSFVKVGSTWMEGSG